MSYTHLIERIRSRLPDADPRPTSFHSGSFIIDLKIKDIQYCIEYFPVERAFGLSKIGGELFSTEASLEARLFELNSDNS